MNAIEGFLRVSCGQLFCWVRAGFDGKNAARINRQKPHEPMLATQVVQPCSTLATSRKKLPIFQNAA